MSVAGTYTETPAVFLRPRPLARTPGSFILLPLLPQPQSAKPLPAEVWSKVLSYVISDQEDGRLGVPERRALLRNRWKLLFVCKSWVNVVLPLLYSRVHIFTVSNLQRFAAHLSSSDQRWDSIRRIPYSTPGRWVQTLDLSEIMLANSRELLAADSSFTRLCPLLPFLTALYFIPDMLISNRALAALECKDGIGELRSLKGIKVSAPAAHASAQPLTGLTPGPDSLIRLLRNCPLLESLEIACVDTVGPDLESIIDLDLGSAQDEVDAALPPPLRLHLPDLKYLSLSAIPICALFLTLLRTSLPELRHLAVTPYSGRHTAQLSALLAAHGRGLTSLRINTPHHLPTSTGDMPPPQVLASCPELHYLALGRPLPEVLMLPAPPLDGNSNDEPPHPHPLRVLTIPRPSARFLRGVEAILPRLPTLAIVRVRTVRWLCAGVSRKALEAGMQGEMHEWRRRFVRKGVRLVDGDWRDPE